MHRLLLSLTLLLSCAAAVAAPRVVVTIKPLHSLAAGVMQDVGEPELLIEGAASPHTYSLRPREARALSRAELVVRVGPDLERFLDKPLTTLADEAAVLNVGQLPGLIQIEAAHAHDDHQHGAADPHVWLDPRNAVVISRALADRLAVLDPANADRYRANAEALASRLVALDKALQNQLQPLQNRPFVVFHDGYRYFQQRYGLNLVGAVTVSPDRAPGSRQVARIRERIQALGAVCVFSEPQFEPRLIRTLVRGTAAQVAALDPLGVDLPAGPTAYFRLMQDLADAAAGCLSRSRDR